MFLAKSVLCTIDFGFPYSVSQLLLYEVLQSTSYPMAPSKQTTRRNDLLPLLCISALFHRCFVDKHWFGVQRHLLIFEKVGSQDSVPHSSLSSTIDVYCFLARLERLHVHWTLRLNLIAATGNLRQTFVTPKLAWTDGRHHRPTSEVEAYWLMVAQS